MKIIANAKGSRTIEVTDLHMETLRRYVLLKNLIDSNGIIDESTVDKLKYNCRSILESQTEVDRQLMDLCLDVVYNSDMKAIGLHNLVLAFIEWENQQSTDKEASQQEVTA
jgi:hypothetical protein